MARNNLNETNKPVDLFKGFDVPAEGGANAANNAGDCGKTEPVGPGIETGGETEPVDRGEKTGKAFRPIVGWLVCTAGNDRGSAFQLYDGDNYIGRAGGTTKHDINVNDNTVSRETTADMYYERRGRTFTFSRMPGIRTECWFNDKKPIINSEQEMKRYDRITIGKTDLMLIPLCSEEFDWDDTF